MNRKKEIAGAVTIWLESKNNLSSNTRDSYGGELRRFTEFFAAEGTMRCADLTEDDWLLYLESLTNNRLRTKSSRGKQLSKSSTNQAGRITRSFLAWAWEQELLEWRPKGWQASRVEASKLDVAAPAMLDRALSGEIRASNESEYRGLLALNLTFWACLDPVLLASLKATDLRLIQGGHFELRLRTDKRKYVYLPKHLGPIWAGYRKSFCRQHEIHPRAFLLASLLDGKGITAWSAWMTIHHYQVRHLGLKTPLSSRQLHQLFIEKAKRAQNPQGSAFLDHAGRETYVMRNDAMSGRRSGHRNPNFLSTLGRIEKSIRHV
ncbi:MAG: site-specific integrase [Stenotrophobium sp.]